MTQPDTDLALIDAALAEARVTTADPTERELQELALALRADSPEPSPAFADELGERVRKGFPRTGPAQGVRGLAERLPRPRRLLPVLAAAATLLIALAIAVPLLSGGGGGDAVTGGGAAPSSDSAQPPAAESESRSGMSQAPSPVPPPGGTGPDFDPGRDRRSIERSASLTLEAPGDELDRVAEGVAKVADRQRGFVLRSSVSSGDTSSRGTGESSGGSLDLRVPADRLRDTLRDLSALGKVRSRSESGQDVTASVVGASDRLQSARAERASLLRRLRRADTDTQAESLRQRLDANAIEIRRLRTELRSLRLRTNYAAITVTLSDGSRGDALGGPDDSTADALDDAAASLQSSLNFLLRAGGALLPLGLLLAAAGFGGRALMRRRRESALA